MSTEPIESYEYALFRRSLTITTSQGHFPIDLSHMDFARLLPHHHPHRKFLQDAGNYIRGPWRGLFYGPVGMDIQIYYTTNNELTFLLASWDAAFVRAPWVEFILPADRLVCRRSHADSVAAGHTVHDLPTPACVHRGFALVKPVRYFMFI